MSADNWTQCPQCKKNNEAKADELDAKVHEAYGKRDPIEFMKLRDEALAFRNAIGRDDEYVSTLREDYQVGITDGEFSVSYGGRCICGFSFKYYYRCPAEANS